MSDSIFHRWLAGQVNSTALAVEWQVPKVELCRLRVGSLVASALNVKRIAKRTNLPELEIFNALAKRVRERLDDELRALNGKRSPTKERSAKR